MSMITYVRCPHTEWRVNLYELGFPLLCDAMSRDGVFVMMVFQVIACVGKEGWPLPDASLSR